MVIGRTSVEVLFDSALEAMVRADWDALEAHGLSSLAAHRSASNRPHITMFEGTTDVAADALHGDALAVPFALKLGPPLLFGSGPRRVLARSVVPTAELVAMHAAIHDQLPAASDAHRMLAGNWMPHVTLARRIRLADLEQALELLGADADGLEGEAVSLRRWNSETRTEHNLA